MGIIGDYDPQLPSHRATDNALAHAADALGVAVTGNWLPTPSLEDRDSGAPLLERCDVIWLGPGSPYRSETGALEAVRFAREAPRPFLGTCGGFQYTLVEYARHVLGMTEAAHQESQPAATDPLITRMQCSLAGSTRTVVIQSGTMAHRLYGKGEATEAFRCNYGLNPALRERMLASGLLASGRDADGEIRIIELPGHPFFMASLFLPQLSSWSGSPHPFITGLLAAALERWERRPPADNG